MSSSKKTSKPKKNKDKNPHHSNNSTSTTTTSSSSSSKTSNPTRRTPTTPTNRTTITNPAEDDDVIEVSPSVASPQTPNRRPSKGTGTPRKPITVENEGPPSLQWKIVKCSNKPTKRGFHSCTAVGTKLYLIGGDDRITFFNDMYEFDTKTQQWTQLPKSCNLKLPRTGHSCIYYDNKLYVFGGKQQSKYLSDLLVFDLNTRTWETVKANTSLGFKILPRGAHTASVVGNKMYIFGGLTHNPSRGNGDETELEYLDKLLVFDFDKKLWTVPKTFGVSPPNRAGHAAISKGKNIYIFGGRRETMILHDFWILDTETMRWTSVVSSGTEPETRAGHTMVAIGNTNQILVWGGSDWRNFFSEPYLFDIDKLEWAVLPTHGDVPEARFWHSCNLVGTKLYIFGGGGANGLFNDLFTLDVAPIISAYEETASKLSPVPSSPPQRVEETATTTTISRPPPLTIPSSAMHAIHAVRSPKTPTNTINVKIVYHNEIRIMTIDLDIKFKDLLRRLAEDYGEEVTVKYVDDEKDKITIRSDEELRECIQFFQSRRKSIKLELESAPKQVPTTPHTPLREVTFKWSKGKLIGAGAYGKVYLGMNLETGEFMAVKQVKLTPGIMKESTVKDLMNEINVMNILKHDNIVRYLGAERSQNVLNIFMEYVPGGSLNTVLKQFGSLHEAVVRKYTRQILFGLKFLHDHQIIHRDIKGANILVDERGIVKLADFGHSKILASHETTQNSSIRGTPLYMAPEVISHGKHEKYSDIWSLGCTIVELLTGQPPWPDLARSAENLFSLMFAIAKSNRSPDIPKHITPEGRRFLEKCFKLRPNERATVDELLQEPFVTQSLDVVASSINDSYEPEYQGSSSYQTSVVSENSGYAEDGEGEDPEQSVNGGNSTLVNTADINNFEAYVSDEDEEQTAGTEELTDEQSADVSDDEPAESGDEDDDDDERTEDSTETDDESSNTNHVFKALENQLKNISRMNNSIAAPQAVSTQQRKNDRIINLRPTRSISTSPPKAPPKMKSPPASLNLSRAPIISNRTNIPEAAGSSSRNVGSSSTAPVSSSSASSSHSLKANQEEVLSYIKQSAQNIQASLNSLTLKRNKSKKHL